MVKQRKSIGSGSSRESSSRKGQKAQYASKYVANLLDKLILQELASNNRAPAMEKWMKKMKNSVAKKVHNVSSELFMTTDKDAEALMSEIKVTQKNIEEIQHKETRKIWKNTKFLTTSSSKHESTSSTSRRFSQRILHLNEKISHIASQSSVLNKELATRNQAFSSTIQIVDELWKRIKGQNLVTNLSSPRSDEVDKYTNRDSKQFESNDGDMYHTLSVLLREP